MLRKPKWFGLINSLAVQRVAAILLAVLVVVYTVYHVASLFGEDITTVASGMMTEAKVIDGKGYIFRDEDVLYSQNGGIVDYVKPDGSKVSVGEELANVYKHGDADANQLLRLIDGQIEVLERSVESGYTLADLTAVSNGIDEAYYSLSRLLAAGDTGSISKQVDKLLLNMNCHSLLTDPSSPVDDTLRALREQRDTITESGGTYITEIAPDSGYFYNSVDGYEEYFTLDAAASLTPESFYALTGDVRPDDAARRTSYGKLARSQRWNFVMRVSELNEAMFSLGETLDFNFIENGNASIPMTLDAIIEDTVAGSGSILVFSADRLPQGFSFDRQQSVSVTVSSVSGIYVPRSAVHRENGEYYVYVLDGSVVRVRYVDVIYEGSDYFLGRTDVTDEERQYLSINEQMVIKGNNLFDGRILD